MMKKQIVLFDTSYYRQNHKKLDKKFPIDEYIHCIDAETLLELSDTQEHDGTDKNDKGSIDAARKTAYQQFELGTLRVFSNSGSIIRHELQKSNPYFPFSPTEQELRKYIEAARNGNKQAIDILAKALQKEEEVKDDFWGLIPSSNSCEISAEEIEKKKKQIYIDEEPEWAIRLHTEKFITNLIYELGFEARYPNVKRYLSLRKPKDRKDFYWSGLCQLKEKYPAIHNFYTFQALILLLNKPVDSKKQFTIKAAGCSIKIDRNTIVDMRITLTSLPYVDLFATSDKNLRNLLNFITPQYSQCIYDVGRN